MKALLCVIFLLAFAFAQAGELATSVFIKQRYSSASDDGVVSYDVGRQGVVVERRGDKCLVQIGEDQVEIPAAHLTSDPAEVAAAKAAQSQVYQDQAAAFAAKQRAAVASSEQTAALKVESDKKASIEKAQATLASAEAEKDRLQKERKESIRRGNDPSTIENRKRADRIAELRTVISTCRAELGKPALKGNF